MQDIDLDTPLLEFSDTSGTSVWTIRNAVEGVQIFGSIGSGKTSGSGRMLALKYLSHGFGGLVLAAKPSEKELWQEYCRETGREADLIVIEPGGTEFFNFIEYESGLGGSGYTENVVQVLKTIIKASEEASGKTENDSFWENALDMLMFNVIDLCKLAYGNVSVEEIYDIVMSSPKKDEDKKKPESTPLHKTSFGLAFELARNRITGKVEEWEKEQPAGSLDGMTPREFEKKLFEVLPETRVIKSLDNFFNDNYKTIGEKTRSIIDFSFSGFLFRLLRDPVYSLFCHHTSTVTPEDCFNGKIILLNFPVKLYHKVGRDCQLLFKYVWQRAMEKRNIEENGLPVFLWADEAQNFLHEHDPDYQATARSSRICTVYLSQNLPNYLANLGGDKSEYKVKSFLGTLGTKFFHANSDVDTNKYASDLIGQAYTPDNTRSTTMSGDFSVTKGLSHSLEYMVRPEEFVGLKNGGPPNNFRVHAYMHRQGRPFHNGFNHYKIKFNQKI